MPLKEYKRKRNFNVTAEPSGNRKASGTRKALPKKAGSGRRFVIQQHDASRLHFDFRLELGGTLVSWAVPKGLPLKHAEKHLAVKVEDHPLSYFDFEGTIPKGQYGGGTVQVWDVGTYEPLSKTPAKELKGGKLHFILHGTKLSGEWYLVRLRDEDNWLIIRGGPNHARIAKKTASSSALTGRTLPQIAKHEKPAKRTKTVSIIRAADEKGKAEAEAEDTGRVPHNRANDHSEILKLKVLQADEVKFIEPMKARLVDEAPQGDWEYEVKFDGFRAVAYRQGGGICLLSRTRHDLTGKFPEIAHALMELEKTKFVLDGEIVALDAQGRSSFQLLQAYELGQEKPPLCYYIFDILSVDGKSQTALSLHERRKKLKEILPTRSSILRLSASLGEDAAPVLKEIQRHGLEGIIGKRKGSTYEPGRRSGEWIKLKVHQQQEFVIGGYTEPSGARSHLGALLVGVLEKGKLIYSGKVGTGFTAATLKELHQQMAKLKRTTCPFSDLPEEREGRYGQGITAAVMKRCHWVKPVLVCQVKFGEWTRDGRLRQPVYLGLREDKPAREVVRELPD
ncbi:non-homologous end-joining DNA ligase [Verrucomicrobium sp. BvORR034]|uniref:non-homologous end-joining DNA ligase n=1 Tax=Verrucomicrobium sp. BvORR034 TaxID=1396418 RepID=UPI000678C644|nr:non-homologous end-joining DNA ligase [Verrucomicrobium sp. BvORR034]